MSQRTEQVESNLQQIVAEVISREVELPQDHLVTVTRVHIAPDLKNATVYFSVLPFDSSEEIKQLLERKKNLIQQEVHKKLTMKFSPVFQFELDTKPEEASEIERLIDEEMNLLEL